jgi:GAF domain-containing protein
MKPPDNSIEIRSARQLVELSRRWLAGFYLRQARAAGPVVLLDAAIRATGADFGNLQLLNPQNGALEIVAQRGFSAEFLEFFSVVHDDLGACGRAKASGERTVVEDVLADDLFAEIHIREVMTRAGVRGIQSTPLRARSGELLGMFSTHFRDPHRPADYELRLLDSFGRTISDFIESQRFNRNYLAGLLNACAD